MTIAIRATGALRGCLIDGALGRFGPLAIGQPSAHVGNAAQTARDRRWRHAVLRSERITPRVGRQGG